MSDTSQSAYEALIQFLYQAPIGLVQTTLDGQITLINPMSAQLLMPLVPDGNLANLFDVLAPLAPQLRDLAARPSQPGQSICAELRLSYVPPDPRAAGPTTLSLNLLRLDNDSLMASLSDVTLIVQQEGQRLASRLHDANRIDSLTSMPNRAVVLECIERALQQARSRPERRFAVLFINADRFNRTNVTLGPAAGDELLRQMATRLGNTLRLHDAVARSGQPLQTTGRLGGDEFVVVLEGLRRPGDVPGVAHRLVDTLAKPYDIGGQMVHATASVGVVVWTPSAGDADSVLQDASLAMREAKRSGGARYCIFEPAMKERAWRRGSLESELRQGLADRQLFVVYQPIVDLVECAGSTGAGDGAAVASIEALVRWRHPVRGTVPPVEFIEIAEETGLIGPLGEFVLNQACRQFVEWQAQLGDHAPLTLSVNLSRAQLLEPGLLDQVRQALHGSGLQPNQLQLEITESLAAQDGTILSRLHGLKELGVTLALDDFGTGYSSLASLHLMPVDVVKIDRSFVSQIETSEHHRVLIEATVRVARSLNMRTVAEGIETVGQARLLAALHCDKGQGYFYSKPLPADEATRWLAERPLHLRPAPGGLRVGAAPNAFAGAATPLAGDAALLTRLLGCLDQSAVGIALFDPAEQLSYANRSYRKVYWDGLEGRPSWEAIMRQAHRSGRGVVIETDDLDGWLADVRRRYRQSPSRSFESDISDGRWLRVTEETRSDGWQLCTTLDVSSLKANEAALQQAHDNALLASVTDPLTDLPNRRHVFERLAEQLAEATALRIALTVAVIDLDEFKAINDTHGHGVGDQVLVAFAITLKARLRQRDAVGRIGGEEFLLVLSNTGRKGAERVLAALRSAMLGDPLQLRVPGLKIDFSSGITEAAAGDDIESIIHRADQGLYQAKAAGRGCDRFVAAAPVTGTEDFPSDQAPSAPLAPR